MLQQSAKSPLEIADLLKEQKKHHICKAQNFGPQQTLDVISPLTPPKKKNSLKTMSHFKRYHP